MSVARARRRPARLIDGVYPGIWPSQTVSNLRELCFDVCPALHYDV
jgi:hypothetical protein